MKIYKDLLLDRLDRVGQNWRKNNTFIIFYLNVFWLLLFLYLLPIMAGDIFFLLCMLGIFLLQLISFLLSSQLKKYLRLVSYVQQAKKNQTFGANFMLERKIEKMKLDDDLLKSVENHFRNCDQKIAKTHLKAQRKLSH